jgi:hypothetical protein
MAFPAVTSGFSSSSIKKTHMRLKLLYTAILTLCMSAFASSNECAGHSRETVHEAAAGQLIQTDKPLVPEQDRPIEYPDLLLTLYV